jgi:two-component system response regulator HydG
MMVKILVVDDEEMIMNIMTRKISRSGYEVVSANGGNPAFNIIEQDSISLVLTDINMPDGDGLTLLNKIKSKFSEMPIVILMSGYSNVTKEKAIELGAIDLISKPFLPQTIMDIIEKALAQAKKSKGSVTE